MSDSLSHWNKDWGTWSGLLLTFSGETVAVEPERRELGDNEQTHATESL